MLTLLVAALALSGYVLPTAAVAQSPGAQRHFSSDWVAPGGSVEVTVSAFNYGSLGQIVETLPDGFSFAGASLPSSAVDVSGQVVSITLLGEDSVSYMVVAPRDEGSHSFSGILRDVNKTRQAVAGSQVLRVGLPPTPTPAPAPTPTPAPAITPTPTSTSTPQPTPAPAPTATTAPPSAVSTTEPVTAPTPAPAATDAPTPTPPAAIPQPAAEQESQASPWPYVILGVVLFLLVIGVGSFMYRRRSNSSA